MRVGILTQYYPPEIGAPQARLSELARWFVQRGHEVYVLTAMPNYPLGKIYSGYGGFFKREEKDGVRIIRSYIFPSKSVSILPRLANYFSFVISSIVIGIFALPRLDYLITESPPLFLGISGYLLTRLKRIKWIFNVSDLWPESAVRLGIIRGGIFLKIAYALESFCYRKAFLVTGQSKEILENIQERFPKVPTYHLSNGVDTDLFRPDLRSEELRRQMFNGISFIAVYAGLHGIAQGLSQLIESAAQLTDMHNFSMVFIGDGPEKTTLINKAQQMRLTNIRFLDPLPHNAMPSILASTDIALVPLKNKLPGAVPSKIYEAMGSGLPVVLVADGEAAQIISDAGAGAVVGPGDIKTLAAVLRDLIQNDEKRLQMGRNGRAAAKSRFDRKLIANGFVDFLEEKI
jgi:colanic acid biosynthesis glycosyl transferase WcaI